MTTGVINIEAIRNKVKTFFKHDKQDGVKKAWYFYHNDTNQFMAMDRSDFETQVALYKSQGLIQYKEVKGESLGSKSCKVLVFRLEDLSDPREFKPDILGMGLGYFTGSAETVIAEVVHSSTGSFTPKKKKRKKRNKR